MKIFLNVLLAVGLALALFIVTLTFEIPHQENILILGTMPGEIYSGYVEAADLVSSDWLYWGDVQMLVESSNISASDSVAWFSM